MVDRTNTNPYLALGVRPFINCSSVRTLHSGSLMLPEVRPRSRSRRERFVNLDELMEAAGARIAELTGAEWGLVTCGSAAALTLATAACVAGNDPAKILRLPFTDGWPNRVIDAAQPPLRLRPRDPHASARISSSATTRPTSPPRWQAATPP